MEGSHEEKKGDKKVTSVTTVPFSLALHQINKNITITTQTNSKSSKQEIINEAFRFHSETGSDGTDSSTVS